MFPVKFVWKISWAILKIVDNFTWKFGHIRYFLLIIWLYTRHATFTSLQNIDILMQKRVSQYQTFKSDRLLYIGQSWSMRSIFVKKILCFELLYILSSCFSRQNPLFSFKRVSMTNSTYVYFTLACLHCANFNFFVASGLSRHRQGSIFIFTSGLGPRRSDKNHTAKSNWRRKDGSTTFRQHFRRN